MLHEERLPQRAARLGKRVARHLGALAEGRADLRWRGRGLLWGIELANGQAARRAVGRARQRGLLLLSGGERGAVLQLAPPLTIAERQLDYALAALAEVL